MRMTEDEFRALGFHRIGWPSYKSVMGELERVKMLYGQDEQVA